MILHTSNFIPLLLEEILSSGNIKNIGTITRLFWREKEKLKIPFRIMSINYKRTTENMGSFFQK